jgi:3-dehydroquinate dehydratase/shikimate dehydrogenase
VALVVAEPTPAGFWRALEQARRQARVIELRLDALGSVAAVVALLEQLSRRGAGRKAALIATCRSRAEGGGFAGGPSTQLALLALAARAGCEWVDIEAATLETLPPQFRTLMLPPARLIVSHHDFRGAPPLPGLRQLFERMRRLGADRVKIAVTASRQSDNSALLALARRARSRLIAISMGTVGIPGRVLALRAGSPLTYAAPDRGPATAPGQLRWSELRGMYRAQRLTSRTRVYGVIGQPIAHSLSPLMHNAAFRAAGMDAVYLPFEVADLRDFLGTLSSFGVAGFSVTIPHKQAVLRYLDGVDPLAEMIGAVNTVVVRGDGSLYGYNTDYVGVLRTLQRLVRLEGSRVLIVGAGGAARAVALALATAGAFVSVSARRLSAARELARAVGGEAVPRAALRRRRFEAIINCTPVGQAPAESSAPLRAEELNAEVLFDLVYNPLETTLLRLARRRGLKMIPGWQMLVEQGAAQFEIWTGLRAPLGVMRRAVLQGLGRAKE